MPRRLQRFGRRAVQEIEMVASQSMSPHLHVIAASVAVLKVEEGGGIAYAAANERYLAMLGFEGSLIGLSPSVVLPGYLVPDFNERLARCIETRAPVEFDVVSDRCAQTTWWRTTLLPMVDGADRVVRVFVTAIDITEKKQLEIAIRESREHLNAVVDSAYDAIITVDPAQRIKFMNHAALRMFGWDAQEIIGQPLDVLVARSGVDAHARYVETFHRSPIRARGMRERSAVHGRRRDGTEFPVQISISKVQLEGGVEMTAIVRDVTETTRLIAALQATATSDALTGVATRRRFLDALEIELKRAQRHGRALSVVLFDIDHFKRVNDEFGHPIGDAALAAFGEILGKDRRASDVAGRLGGEEFALLLTETPLASAHEVADRLRLATERIRIDDGRGGRLGFTVSAGVAGLTPQTNSAAELVAAADRALYAAKHAGRNRVALAPPYPQERGHSTPPAHARADAE
jgi:diguanylate cyclase (GGDEF)-like protein/PAS domain S-box-containing protein